MTGRADGGFATVWVAAVSAVLMSIFLLVLTLGAATVARHRAEAAADLAALAAAAHAVSGPEAACARARWVVERMGARLDACGLDGWVAAVAVTVRPGLPTAGAASARARAGPAADGSTVGSIR
ncbi:Rv3654c family TadE-like protein [Actinokineospora enzanensis]|uniref:Rv3654c family TadE-like protein n=1 Tax=Actinokineospora enzanensis TaxID=155975 RepID=UPI000361418A|nr:Rv3654c family TadE-like protein [Actinokineospora enzanensis]